MKNNGELAKYFVEEALPPIISKEMFHAVEEEIERRRKLGLKASHSISFSPFTSTSRRMTTAVSIPINSLAAMNSLFASQSVTTTATLSKSVAELRRLARPTTNQSLSAQTGRSISPKKYCRISTRNRGLTYPRQKSATRSISPAISTATRAFDRQQK